MEYFLAILGYFSLLTICNAHGQNFYMGRTYTRWPLTALYIWSLWNERKACSLIKNTGFRRIFFCRLVNDYNFMVFDTHLLPGVLVVLLKNPRTRSSSLVHTEVERITVSSTPMAMYWPILGCLSYSALWFICASPLSIFTYEHTVVGCNFSSPPLVFLAVPVLVYNTYMPCPFRY